MKLVLRRAEPKTGCPFVLTTEAGDVLPNQESAVLINEHGEIPRLVVTFGVFSMGGESIRIEDLPDGD